MFFMNHVDVGVGPVSIDHHNDDQFHIIRQRSFPRAVEWLIE